MLGLYSARGFGTFIVLRKCLGLNVSEEELGLPFQSSAYFLIRAIFIKGSV